MAIYPEALQDSPAYDAKSINVISSSKIHNRVTRVLQHLFPARFSPPDDATKISGTTDNGPTPETRPRPRVVILTAKSPVASKLLSIAEIVKQDVATYYTSSLGDEATTVQSSTPTGLPPKIYQYTSVHGITPGPKLGPPNGSETSSATALGKRKRGDSASVLGSAPANVDEGDSDALQANACNATDNRSASNLGQVSRKNDEDGDDIEHTILVPATGNPKTSPLAQRSLKKPADDYAFKENNARSLRKDEISDGHTNDDDDDGAYFEALKASSTGQALGLREKEQRQIPVLTIYLALESLEELRDRFGEQIT